MINEWISIEHVPTDGRWVLATSEGEIPKVVAYRPEHGSVTHPWYELNSAGSAAIALDTFTHWMRLPSTKRLGND